MVEDDGVRADLLQRISSRRASLQAYLREHRPRFRRRANATIVLSTLAAVSTAGPAVGGESFAGGVEKALGLSSDSYVWRVLCLLALLVSIGAAVLTNLAKSDDQGGRLSTAEAVDGELEGLSFLLEFGQLPLPDAVKLYQQYTAKCTFVPDLSVAVAATRPEEVPVPARDDRPRHASGRPAVPPSRTRASAERATRSGPDASPPR